MDLRAIIGGSSSGASTNNSQYFRPASTPAASGNLAVPSYSKPTYQSGSSIWSRVRAFGTEAWQFFDDAAEGAVEGDFSSKQSIPKIIGQIGAGLVPVYGQVSDMRDTAAAVKDTVSGKTGAWRNLGLALVGWIPLVGDAMKSSWKGAKNIPLTGVDNLMLRLRRQITNNVPSPSSSSASEAVQRMFYRPTITQDRSLLAGEGLTNKYGDITYSSLGSEMEQALAYNHEMVHSFLSPKLEMLREFRADVRMTAYQRSSFLRYLEEAMAETYAQIRVKGASLAALKEGLSFPITNGYVELRNVVTEAAVGTIAVGGATYGVYLVTPSTE